MSTRKLSTAKLAYVPPAQTDRKTKPPGKGIWSRINFFSSTQNSPVQSKRSSSQISSTSRRSQDSASTFLETSSGDRSRVTSRTSSQSANEENPPTPLPRKSSLADSFFPEKARRESQKSSTQQSQLNGQSSSKNKTTVVVHMSQNNNFSNNPRFRNNNASHNQNFMQQFNSPRFANKEFQLNDKKKNESNRPPLARPIAANSANQWNNFVHPRRVSWETGRNQMQETITNSRIISQNKPLHQLQQISGRNEERIFWTPTPEKRNHGSESNFQTDEQPRLTQSPRNSSWLNRNMQHRSTEDILSLNQSKGSFWENTNKIRSKSTWHINNEPNAIQEHRLNNQIMSRSSSNINELAPNLNSLQVFRQNKYKERHMAERNIRNHLHLQTNGHCSDLVQILGKGFNPGMYENTNHLGVVQQETKSNIITSSRIPIKAQIVEQKPKFPPVPRKPQFPREHIYAEIEENISPINTPTMHRRVTFSTIHNPLMETDQSFSDKKVSLLLLILVI